MAQAQMSERALATAKVIEEAKAENAVNLAAVRLKLLEKALPESPEVEEEFSDPDAFLFDPRSDSTATERHAPPVEYPHFDDEGEEPRKQRDKLLSWGFFTAIIFYSLLGWAVVLMLIAGLGMAAGLYLNEG